MTRKTLTMLAVLALSAFLCTPTWAQNNSGGVVGGTQAVVPVGADPVGFSAFNTVSACNGPADAPFPADNSYTFTLTTAKRLVIGEIDCCCTGDYYAAFLNGTLFNLTPNPFDYCPAGTDPWGCTTGTCNDPSAGRTSACVAAGSYSLRVTDPGFAGHSAAEIAAEGFCPAGFTDTISTGDATDCSCRELQLGVILAVPDEDTFQNHGQYVSAATHALQSLAAGSTVSPECSSCIVNQFARSVPQSQMVSCGTL